MFSKKIRKMFSEKAKKRFTTHGLSKTKTYVVWQAMLNRCRNKHHKRYKHYGGKGIGVCKHWGKFENFYRDMGERPCNKSIGRINNNMGYSKENCRWETFEQQNNNTSKNIFIRHNGKILSITQWARKINMCGTTLRYRILKAKWPLEKAFNCIAKKGNNSMAPHL